MWKFSMGLMNLWNPFSRCVIWKFLSLKKTNIYMWVRHRLSLLNNFYLKTWSYIEPGSYQCLINYLKVIDWTLEIEIFKTLHIVI